MGRVLWGNLKPTAIFCSVSIVSLLGDRGQPLGVTLLQLTTQGDLGAGEQS